MREHIRIWIQERDPGVVRQPRMLQEVTSTRPDVEMPVAHMSPVVLHHSRGRAPPHDVAVEAEDHRIVDPQERAAVYFLAGVSRVRWLHESLATCALKNSATSRLKASGASKFAR